MFKKKTFSGGRTGGRADGRTGGRAHGRTGGRADGRTGERADGRTGGRADGRTDARAPPLEGGPPAFGEPAAAPNSPCLPGGLRFLDLRTCIARELRL